MDKQVQDSLKPIHTCPGNVPRTCTHCNTPRCPAAGSHLAGRSMTQIGVSNILEQHLKAGVDQIPWKDKSPGVRRQRRRLGVQRRASLNRDHKVLPT